MNTLLQALKEKNIESAFFTGLGGFLEAELGFYDLDEKKYLTKTFDDDTLEAVSLTGDIAMGSDNKPVIHCHAVIAGRDYKAVGGHLVRATVGGTIELQVIRTKEKLVRHLDPSTGLHVLNEIK